MPADPDDFAVKTRRRLNAFTVIGYGLLGVAAVLTVMVIIVGGNGGVALLLLANVGLSFVVLGYAADIRAMLRRAERARD